MDVGLLADTHDNVAAIEAAVATFEDRDIGTVVHCGDFIAPLTIPYFEGLELHGVVGNNDGEVDGLTAAFESLAGESKLHGREATIDIDGVHLCVLHGDQGLDAVDDRARSGAYDVICYGHFHTRDHREVGDALVINPGAHFPTVDPADRTVAILDTADRSVEFVEIHSD